MALSEEVKRARRAAYQRQYRLMHPDRIREQKRRRKDDPKKDARDRSLRKLQPDVYVKAALRRYGLTLEAFLRLSAAQGNQCAICGMHAKDCRGGRLHVDHCHDTGKIRGLLCGLCNSGLGHFKDSLVLLTVAVNYLSEE